MRRWTLFGWFALAVAIACSAAYAASTRTTARTSPRAPAAEAPPVTLDTPEGGTTAFVAQPPGTGPAPSMVMVHEWWGLNDQIKGLARRLAQQGYVVIVPDLYHGKVAGSPEEAHELMRGLEDTRVFDEMDSARRWLAAQPRSAKGKTGVIGFCVGGGITLRYALRTPDLSAAVMFYGPPETDPAKLAPLKAPLMGHFGADDEGITPDRVNAFQAALESSGKTASIYEYKGAGHAFMHDGNPSYRADAARLAWARTLDFLQKNLK